MMKTDSTAVIDSLKRKDKERMKHNRLLAILAGWMFASGILSWAARRPAEVYLQAG